MVFCMVSQGLLNDRDGGNFTFNCCVEILVEPVRGKETPFENETI
jgi:hypothetical protein